MNSSVCHYCEERSKQLVTASRTTVVDAEIVSEEKLLS